MHPACERLEHPNSLKVCTLVGLTEGVCPDGQLDIAGAVQAFHLRDTAVFKHKNTLIPAAWDDVVQS